MRGWKARHRSIFRSREGASDGPRRGAVPKKIEFEIEGNGDVCRLGVVQSGYGESGRFDDEYEANCGGCCTHFSVLKLLHYRDDACTPMVSFRNLKMSRKAIVKTLSQVLAFGCPLYELREGATYEASLGDLNAIRGIRFAPHKKSYYLFSMENCSHSVFELFAEQAGENCFFLRAIVSIQQCDRTRQ